MGAEVVPPWEEKAVGTEAENPTSSGDKEVVAGVWEGHAFKQ